MAGPANRRVVAHNEHYPSRELFNVNPSVVEGARGDMILHMGAVRTTLTMEEFLELSELPAGKRELLRGELIELPPGKFKHMRSRIDSMSASSGH